MRKINYTVAPGTEAERLDMYITSQSNHTRSQVQKMIKDGLITVNGKIEKMRYHVKEGDRIGLTFPDEPDGTLVPEDIPLDIIYEDEHMIVVNKPPHMVVYPALGNLSGTLMNALISRCTILSTVGAPLRPGVVHRLDKDTSGIMVVAKKDAIYYNLITQFKERTVEKHYRALVFGSIKEDKGEIRTLIGRSRSNRKKMSVKPWRGKEAVTQFEVLNRFQSASLVKVRLITGRTHQIRVHFSSRGYPVLGDRTYGNKTELRIGEKTICFPRQMLHACSLKLDHPVTGSSMTFTAALPEDMERAIGEMVQK